MSDRILDDLDSATGDDFTFTSGGVLYLAPDPRDLPWPEVVRLLASPANLALFVGLGSIPAWMVEQLHAAWAARFDLGTPQGAARLRYLLETYGLALEYDLAHELPGVDVGELWRSRQWRRLLNYIDHLPSHTHYYSLVSKDEKHAEMLLEAQEAEKRSGRAVVDGGPALSSWSPEVNMLAAVYDAIRGVQFAVSASGGGKPDRPTPYPRPKTAIEVVRLRRRQRNHESLSARLLPNG